MVTAERNVRRKLRLRRTGGRSPALKPKDIAAAKALLKDPGITVVEVALP